MQLPLQITFRNMEPSSAVEAAVRERVERLDHFHPRIMGCRVVVEAPHRHQHKGKLYGIKVDLTIPGAEIAVTHEGRQNHAHEDVYVAIHDTFDSVARLLEDRVRKQRGDVKTHEVPLHGKVLRLFPYEGYGFVATSDGNEVYFHRNAVSKPGFDKLDVGAEVRLVLAEGEGEKGPQASTVTAIGKHHFAD
jgi:ribosomal subunit interface protein